MEDKTDSKTRLLDTAERLLAEKGLNCPVREIVAEAEVNISAINYYFGSKDEMIREVFRRRIEELNADRLGVLENVIESSAKNKLECKDVIFAFLSPAFDIVESDDVRAHSFLKLMGTLHLGGGNPELKRFVIDQFDQVVKRFLEVLQETLPDVPPEKLAIKFYFMVGTMVHALHGLDVPDSLGGILNRYRDSQLLLRELVEFITNGFIAGGQEWDQE